VNKKRVYRLMRRQNLLLERHTARPIRVHDGVISTKESNQRWCSDDFEIACKDGAVVRVSFCLDCHDREVLSFVATTKGVGSELVRDLLAQALDRRFGAQRPPKPVEWLTDNGPGYTAKDTGLFARKAGLLPCTTAPYSPESNGMAEAFVKTFKRDYVAYADRETAEMVLVQLEGWFWDYNHCHPHSALGMLSPQEYISLRR
jgi:putative transposase